MFPDGEYMFRDAERMFTDGKCIFSIGEHKKYRECVLFPTPEGTSGIGKKRNY